MILDNLSRALKTQNWLAAALEFIIVLAGVVIGFQINAWNEARMAAVDYRNALSEIETQIRADIAEIDYQLGRIQQVQTLGLDVLPAMARCELPPDEQAALSQLIVGLGSDVVPTYQNRGVTRLLGSERLRARADDDILSALEAYEASTEEENAQLRLNFQLLWQDHVMFHPYVGADLDVTSEDGQGLRLGVPVETACADPSFQRALFVSYSLFQTFAVRMIDHRNLAETTLAALSSPEQQAQE